MHNSRRFEAICAQLELHTFHIDFETAFVQSDIDVPIYCSYPAGINKKKNGKELFMKLQKSLYGLKQAPRNWNIKLTNWLKQKGFKQSEVDPCFFYYTSAKEKVHCYLNVYVDDLPGGHNNPEWFAKFISEMKEDFKVGSVEDLQWVMQVEVKKIPNGLQFCHKKYINDLLQKYDMLNCKPQAIPLDPSFEIKMDDTTNLTDVQRNKISTIYKELVGSLLWIARVDRPDIQHAVSVLCRFTSNPSPRHLQALRGILAYLAGTRDLGTAFTKVNPKNFILSAFSDSDWASDKDTRHSTSGYILFLGTSPISWSSSKQGLVTTSTTEAEYVGLSNCAKEVSYVRQLMESLGMNACLREPSTLHGDNQGALFLGENAKTSTRTKHIDIKYHHIRELVAKGIIALKYIKTTLMVADPLTKALPGCKFIKHLKWMLNLSA